MKKSFFSAVFLQFFTRIRSALNDESPIRGFGKNDSGPAIPQSCGFPSGSGIGFSQGVGGVASVDARRDHVGLVVFDVYLVTPSESPGGGAVAPWFFLQFFTGIRPVLNDEPLIRVVGKNDSGPTIPEIRGFPSGSEIGVSEGVGGAASGVLMRVAIMSVLACLTW